MTFSEDAIYERDTLLQRDALPNMLFLTASAVNPELIFELFCSDCFGEFCGQHLLDPGKQ